VLLLLLNREDGIPISFARCRQAGENGPAAIHSEYEKRCGQAEDTEISHHHRLLHKQRRQRNPTQLLRLLLHFFAGPAKRGSQTVQCGVFK